MNQLVSTLADLTAAKLVQYVTDNAPKRPDASVPAFPQQSTETDAYIKGINFRQAVREVFGSEPADPDPIVGDNQKAIDAFSGQAHEFEQHKGIVPVPTWPTLKTIDTDPNSITSFDAWWTDYKKRYDPNSPYYGNDDYTTFLAKNQFFKINAPSLPVVVILAPSQPPAGPPINTENPVGPKVPGAPWWLNVGGTGFTVGDSDPTGKYRLINPSPMNNDPAKFVWVRA